MNGLKVVVDTNIYYMFFYNPLSKSGKLLKVAIEKKIELFSPDTVKEELRRLLEKDFGLDINDVNFIIDSLPVIWVEKNIYEKYLSKIISHKSDRPILALATFLNCGIITSNRKHFKPAEKIIKIWKIDELLKEIGEKS